MENTPAEIPPQARRLYFIGALAAVDRQLDNLKAERERINLELEHAKSQLAVQKENGLTRP